MKLLVTLTSGRTGQSDYYIAYAEDEFDNNLFSAIDDEYVDLYRDKYYIEYEYCDIEEGFDEYLIEMYSEIESWTDEIEERFKDNLPILYDENHSN